MSKGYIVKRAKKTLWDMSDKSEDEKIAGMKSAFKKRKGMSKEQMDAVEKGEKGTFIRSFLK